MDLPYDPAIPLWNSMGMKLTHQRSSWLPVFAKALFTKPRYLNNLSVHQQINGEMERKKDGREDRIVFGPKMKEFSSITHYK
jgi:hypothetical protein